MTGCLAARQAEKYGHLEDVLGDKPAELRPCLACIEQGSGRKAQIGFSGKTAQSAPQRSARMP